MKMAEQHTIFGGKVYVYKRPNSSRWQCSSFFAGKNRRTSTKEESLAKAKDVAEDWYLQLRGKLRTGELKAEKTFREVSEHFLREYDIMTQGQRNKHYVDGKTLAVERSLGGLLRKHGHLEDHHGKNRRISNSQTPTSNCETRQAAGTQHDQQQEEDGS
jgi:hypothetical protein